jgi:hypothetical protein
LGSATMIAETTLAFFAWQREETRI